MRRMALEFSMRVFIQYLLAIQLLLPRAICFANELPDYSSVVQYEVRFGTDWHLSVGRAGRVVFGFGSSGGDAMPHAVTREQVAAFDRLCRDSVSMTEGAGFTNYLETKVAIYLITTNGDGDLPLVGVLSPGLKEFVANTLAAYPNSRIVSLTNRSPIYSPEMVKAGDVALKKHQENGGRQFDVGKPVIGIAVAGKTPRVPAPSQDVPPATTTSETPVREAAQEGSLGVVAGASMGFRGLLVICLLAIAALLTYRSIKLRLGS